MAELGKIRKPKEKRKIVTVAFSSEEDQELLEEVKVSLEEQYPEMDITTVGILRWLLENFNEKNFKWRGSKDEEVIPEEVE